MASKGGTGKFNPRGSISARHADNVIEMVHERDLLLALKRRGNISAVQEQQLEKLEKELGYRPVSLQAKEETHQTNGKKDAQESGQPNEGGSPIRLISPDRQFELLKRQAFDAGVGSVSVSYVDYRNRRNRNRRPSRTLPTTDEILHSNVPIVEEGRSFFEQGRLLDPTRVIEALFPKKREEMDAQVPVKEPGALTLDSNLSGFGDEQVTLIFATEMPSIPAVDIATEQTNVLEAVPGHSRGAERR